MMYATKAELPLLLRYSSAITQLVVVIAYGPRHSGESPRLSASGSPQLWDLARRKRVLGSISTLIGTSYISDWWTAQQAADEPLSVCQASRSFAVPRLRTPHNREGVGEMMSMAFDFSFRRFYVQRRASAEGIAIELLFRMMISFEACEDTTAQSSDRRLVWRKMPHAQVFLPVGFV